MRLIFVMKISISKRYRYCNCTTSAIIASVSCGRGVSGWTPEGGMPMTVFEALMIALTLALVVIAIMSDKNTKK